MASMLVGSSNVKKVQIDCLAVMKIVKHIDSEIHAGMSDLETSSCQGFLTGLISIEDSRLEVTNCFPTARADPALESDDNGAMNNQYEEQKQTEVLDILRKFRAMNIDYELVGFYQAQPFGACFSQEMIESLVDYQSSVQDCIALIYDPVKTRLGQLAMRAYQLSPKALQMSINGDWSPESVRLTGLCFESLFDELPLVIKNSHLVNVMLSELSLKHVQASKISSGHLELGNQKSLEKCIRSLNSSLEGLNKDIMTYNKYVLEKQKHEILIETMLHKRRQENEERKLRGEPALSIDEIKKMKGPQLGTKCGMLDIFTGASNAAACLKFITDVSGEKLSKVFVTETISKVTDYEDQPPTSSASSTSI